MLNIINEKHIEKPDILKTLFNSLEPESFVDAFLKHPPENFKIKKIEFDEQEVYGFFADLDLFTTVDEKIKIFVDKLRLFKPFDYIIRKFLTFNTLFIGTTVSEYSLFPNSMNLSEFKNKLLSVFQKSGSQFLVIKDLPSESPLLSNDENMFSKEMTSSLENNGFVILAGQALAYLPVDFDSIEEYLKKFTSKRRNNFRRKMKAGANLYLQEFITGDNYFTDEIANILYNLYLNVYNISNIHFDKMTLSFFKHILQNTYEGKVFIYYDKNKIIGFNLCYVMNDYLVDKYRGYLYPEALNFKLFFNQFFDGINYCLVNGLKTYIMGWTAPEVKAYLGCKFTYTYHAVYIKNPIIRFVLTKLKSCFEADKRLIEGLNKG